MMSRSNKSCREVAVSVQDGRGYEEPMRSFAIASLVSSSVCVACSGVESTSADQTASSKWRSTFPVEAQFPEGGVFDPVDEVFYVGSLGDGSVHRIDLATGADELVFRETAAGKWWTLGMDVDVERGHLWVCAMDDAQSPRAGHVWIFDVTSGERIRSYPLSSAAADASCTDVALTASGVGYVGDREQGNVYRVGLDEGPSLFTSSEDLEGVLAGQNAMVVLPDQSALLSLVYLPSRLVRVDLATGETRKVDIDGKFSDLTPLAGADGMTLHDGKAYVVFTTNLMRLTPSDDGWTHATSSWEHVKNGMTDVISTPGGLYLLNGQAVHFALGFGTDPFRLARYKGKL